MRLARAERREQILRVATEAFVEHGGYAATSLEDVARAADITRAILYRHFDSKAVLYRAAVDRAAARLHEMTTTDGRLHEDSVGGMLRWAGDEPAGARLLFHQAAREPEFRAVADEVLESMVAAVRPGVPDPDGPWGQWTARLATMTVVEAILCWLDVGRPDPEQALHRISQALDGVLATSAPGVGAEA